MIVEDKTMLSQCCGIMLDTIWLERSGVAKKETIEMDKNGKYAIILNW